MFVDRPISEVELSELFAGANEEAWYWLLSLLQMANHNIGIAIKGLHNGVQVSLSERNKQTSSICNSYVVSNGLCVEGVAKGIDVCVYVCMYMYVYVYICMYVHTYVCMYALCVLYVYMCVCVHAYARMYVCIVCIIMHYVMYILVC